MFLIESGSILDLCKLHSNYEDLILDPGCE
jgi:hypothetical protein